MVSSAGLRTLGLGLLLFGLVWSLGWAAWLTAQHRAGKLDVAAAILGFLLFAVLPAAVAWVAAAVVLLRARRRAREEKEAQLELRIAEAVRTRGVVRLAELAREWSLSETELRQRLERLVGLGLLEGRVDWARGEVMAPTVKLGESCPRCGGELEPVGANLLRCAYCGSGYPTGPTESNADA